MKIKFAFTLFIAFCKLSVLAQNKNVDEIKVKLAGTWTWQITKICQRSNPAPITPESCNCTQTLVVYPDGTIKLYLNGLLKDSSNYTIDAIANLNDPVFYFFRSDFIKGNINVDEKHLSISTCASDGSNNSYIKENK